MKDKLWHYEAQPPEKIWNEIERALSTPVPLQEKLFHFQEVPQNHVWNNITAGLDKDNNQPTKVASRSRGSFSMIRFAAAAAILLFILVSIVWIMNRTEEDKTVAQNKNVIKKGSKKDTTLQPLENTTNVTNNETEQVTTATLNNGKRSVSDKKAFDPKIQNKISLAKNTTRQKEYINKHQQAIPSIAQNNTEDKYIIYNTASGSPVKVSKKLYTFFSCTIDPDMAQAIWCKQNIRSLQQKVAQASSPTTDFASMLYMIKDLQENQ